MSASNVGGGVRNLRAMFENKGGDQSTSPPSRGRSPSNSIASTSSRPVSKVRASFVAVERSGEQGQLWGLRKASDVSSMAEVKEKVASIIDGPPLTATQSTPERDNSGGLGDILKGSSFAATPMKEKPNAMESTKRSEQPTQKPPADENTQPKPNGIGARAAEAAQKIKDKAKPTATRPNPKPVEIKTSATTKSGKPSPRTPTSAGLKPRGGVEKIKGVMDSAKQAAEGREATRKAEAAKADAMPKSPAKVNGHEPESSQSPRALTKTSKLPFAATTPTAASAAHVHKDPEPVQSPRTVTKTSKLPSAATASTAASAAHIHKDPEPTKKPSHSTRTAKLPSAVTATTAASAAPDRSVPNHQAKKITSRRPSTVHSSHPRLSTASTQSSLKKRASRASLTERPKSRSSLSKPDDGFLARMMRPTQSSSQKTHDKTQINSPPRPKTTAPKAKSTSRLSFSGDHGQHGHHAHHDHSDPAGDYAPNSPPSPTGPKHSAPKAKAKATSRPDMSDEYHGHRAHHDHVDPAGDSAMNPPTSPAAAKISASAPAERVNDSKAPASETQQTAVEEAPTTVAHAEAPVKDMNPAGDSKPATDLRAATDQVEPDATNAKADGLAIEVKPDDCSKTGIPVSTEAKADENQPPLTDLSPLATVDTTAAAPESKADAVAA